MPTSFIKFMMGIALLILAIWFCLILRPSIKVVYPQGNHTILTESMYGKGDKEPSDEMMDDWKYTKHYIEPGESDERAFPLFKGSSSDVLSVVWSLMQGDLDLDDVRENGVPLRGAVNIKRSEVDFCRLIITIDPKGQIIEQKKQKGLCVK